MHTKLLSGADVYTFTCPAILKTARVLGRTLVPVSYVFSGSCTGNNNNSPSSVAGLIEDLGDEKFQVLNEKMIDYFGLCCVLPNFSPSPTFTPFMIVGFSVTILLVGRVSAVDVQESEHFP